jgi:DNA-directed RNA polymerase specialized sigma24 family protein
VGEIAESNALELVGRHRALVYAYLVRCGVRGRRREALFTEVFKQLWDARALLRTQAGLDPWLLAIVVHAVRMDHREHYVQALVFGKQSPASSEPAEDHSDCPNPLGSMEAALLGLPFEQREVFVLCCVERVALADAAFALDLPVATTQLHLQEARLAMARALVRPSDATKERTR